jgi:hypothetical protein
VSQGCAIGLLALFYATLAVVCPLALWKGGAPERAGVALLAVMLLGGLAGQLAGPRFATLDTIALADDLVGFGGFTWIAYHARRFWPIWAAALQLLSLAGHFARVVETASAPVVYALMKSGPTYLIFIALLIGTLGHWRRTRQARRVSSRACTGRAAARASYGRRWHG